MRVSNIKKSFLLLSLLIVCFLAASAGILPGSAQEEHFVPLDLALIHALVAMVEGAVSEMPSLLGRGAAMEEWQWARLGEPLEFFDLTERPLFYSFPVILEDGRMVGRIWVSASRILGTTVASSIVGPRTWHVEGADARAEELAAEEYPGWHIESLRPVVYSYPKVGIQVTLLNPETGEHTRLIIDIADYTVVPDMALEPDVRGVGSWSVYESIPREEWFERIKGWDADNEWAIIVRETFLEAGLDLFQLMERPLSREELFVAKELLASLATCQTLVVPGGVRLHCQQTSVYCTVATAQMIAEFYGVIHTQSHIASVMGTGAGGTSTSGELKYFKDKKKGLGKAGSSVDSTPNSWAEIESEIKAGKPFDSSVPKHSRVAAGARVCERPTGTETSIGIVNPWPPKTGCGEQWDTFGSVKLLEHVFVRD